MVTFSKKTNVSPLLMNMEFIGYILCFGLIDSKFLSYIFFLYFVQVHSDI